MSEADMRGSQVLGTAVYTASIDKLLLLLRVIGVLLLILAMLLLRDHGSEVADTRVLAFREGGCELLGCRGVLGDETTGDTVANGFGIGLLETFVPFRGVFDWAGVYLRYCIS